MGLMHLLGAVGTQRYKHLCQGGSKSCLDAPLRASDMGAH